MTVPTATVQRSHRKAVRFFWGLLIAATTVTLVGNIAHAALAYIPRVLIQIDAAAVPPIALLAAVHGIALAARAGASGRIYFWAVTATGLIGLGAFAVSFLALRDLMQAIGYTPATALTFPAIIDTAVAVATVMLVALGDKPTRRTRTATMPASAQTPAANRWRRVQTHRSCQSDLLRLHAQSVQTDRNGPCISTTRPGADGALSASRSSPGRCRPCVRPDCIRGDHAVG